MIKRFAFTQKPYGKVERGAFHVKVEDDVFVIKHASGKAPDAYLALWAAWDNLPEELKERAIELNKTRKNPFRIRSRRGMSGCWDYWLEVLVDSEMFIKRSYSHLHISMYGKLNEAFRCWLGDLPLFLSELGRPENSFDSLDVKDIETYFFIPEYEADIEVDYDLLFRPNDATEDDDGEDGDGDDDDERRI